MTSDPTLYLLRVQADGVAVSHEFVAQMVEPVFSQVSTFSCPCTDASHTPAGAEPTLEHHYQDEWVFLASHHRTLLRGEATGWALMDPPRALTPAMLRHVSPYGLKIHVQSGERAERVLRELNALVAT